MLALGTLLLLPSLAHADEVTLTVPKTSFGIGEDIPVSYIVATTSFRYSDSICMIDESTGLVVSSKSVGSAMSGTKIFSTKVAGTYFFEYRTTSSSGGLLFGTSPRITVMVPESTLYTLTIPKTSFSTGEPIVVTYAGPEFAHQYSNKLVVVDTVSGTDVASQSIGSQAAGTKTFAIKTPGTYRIEYRLALTGSPVVKTVGPFTVMVPESTLYTLTIPKTSFSTGEPIVVTYAGPEFAHQYSNKLVVVDTVSGTDVASQSIGSQAAGTKTFAIKTPGTYRIEYRLALTGSPVVKTVGPFTVTLPDPGTIILTPSVTTAEINEPIVVTYSVPEYIKKFGDVIVLIDARTGSIIDTELVGSSPSGSETFRIDRTGTFRFGYRTSISGSLTIVKESLPVDVVYVNLARIENHPLRSGPLIAFGDSITFGRDATTGNDFVSLLSARLGVPIVNKGVSGDTTDDALLRINADVLSQDPGLVMVFLGGNDFLQEVPTNEIFANIETITERIVVDGSAVLILAYQDFFFTNYDARYRAIAWEHGAAYVPDVMGGILGNPFRTTDLIHPTNTGHAIIADRIEPYLRALLGK